MADAARLAAVGRELATVSPRARTRPRDGGIEATRMRATTAVSDDDTDADDDDEDGGVHGDDV